MSQQPETPNQSKRIRTEVLVAIIGAVATVLAAGIAILPNLLEVSATQSVPTPQVSIVASTNPTSESLDPQPILPSGNVNPTSENQELSASVMPTSTTDEATQTAIKTPTVVATSVTIVATVVLIQETSTSQITNSTLIEERASIASGGNNDYVFSGIENVPVIITTATRDSIRYWIEVFDPNGGKVFTSGYLSANSQVPFTPQISGESTVRVISDGGFGEYTIKVELLDLRQTTGDTFVPLELGTRATGSIATGAYDEYVFNGTVNVPVIITTVTEDPIRYWIEVFDLNGGKVFTSGYLSANSQVPFTPQISGESTVRVVSDGGFGEYTIKVDLLEVQQTTEGSKITLELGTRVAGSIATGAYDEYVFNGTANIPVVITTVTEDPIRYWIEILDPNGAKVFTSGYLSTNSPSPFTPQSSGDYVIRVRSDGGFGEYGIIINTP